jgi:Holliday junction resolvase-like predicted endonuclease
MMNKNSYQKGLMAEELAKDFLCKAGKSILAERYKTPQGEIDLIAFDKKISSCFLLR